jgi:hypothetical protein
VILELREYRILPGQEEAWVTFVDEEIIPFQVSKGMEVLGSFVDENDPNHYVWLRRFESEEERERLYALVYEDDHWKNNIAPRIPDLLERDKSVVTRLIPTPKSALQ